jgi:hypothetical protein
MIGLFVLSRVENTFLELFVNHLNSHFVTLFWCFVGFGCLGNHLKTEKFFGVHILNGQLE